MGWQSLQPRISFTGACGWGCSTCPTGDFCFRCPLGRENMGSLSCRRWQEEATLLLSTHTHVQGPRLPGSTGTQLRTMLGSSLHPCPGPQKPQSCATSPGAKHGRSLQEWHFPGLPPIFWKDQPIFVLDGERPLRRWVEYKSLLSHCSKQTPTKSRSNYFLQRQEKALFCVLPTLEDTQDRLFPFSKPVAVYTLL